MQYASNASRAISPGGDHLVADTQTHIGNVGTLLAALSAVLRDTVDRFGTISGRVTEHVLTRGSPSDHELVVALQDFDRLQQEFAAFSDVISHCAAASSAQGAGVEQPSVGRHAIDGITLSDLKDRLLMHLQYSDADFADPPRGNDQIF